MAAPGRFIVFEGGDGAGKSTQSARLADWLSQAGYPVKTTFEPGDTPVGARVREIVLHTDWDLDPRAEALLYAVDKAQHVAEVVRPALAAGEIVICDRYVDSTIAYQGAGRALGLDEITRLAWWSVAGLRPDLTVLMDVPVDQGLARTGEPDRMESQGTDFHQRVRDHFLGLAAADPARYLVVNGGDPKDQVTETIRARVETLVRVTPGNI
ncbi:MAG: dTMP kinase [Propionibacteriaceae bacterium]|jgi:dTMP kinase|nr:dTMP kinase [Propionibacteriaceae bacterium]